MNEVKTRGKHPCGKVPDFQALHRLEYLVAAARLPFLRKLMSPKGINTFPVQSQAVPGPLGMLESIAARDWRQTEATQPNL